MHLPLSSSRPPLYNPAESDFPADGDTEKEGGREMTKTIILFFTLLVGIPTLSHAQAAKDALMGLKKLQARTQAGISYSDYSNAVSEAKVRLNLYLESYEAQKYRELSNSLSKTMAHYEYAGMIWNYKNSSTSGIILKDSYIGKELEKNYPNVNKGPGEGGAFAGGIYSPDLTLQVIWTEASEEVKIATKEYEKLEDNLSDQIATLKRSIDELKKEVAMVKKEVDLLKNPKKAKKWN